MVNTMRLFRHFTCIAHRSIGNVRNEMVSSIQGRYSSLISTRSFKSYFVLLSEDKFRRDPTRIVKNDGTVVRKKTSPEVMINLLKDSDMTVLSLKSAQNLAKAKGLNLMKVQDTKKSTRQTFKLVTDAELASSEKKQSKNNADIKTIMLSSAIVDYDLQTKMRGMIKILKKYLKVNCAIKHNANLEKAESIFEKIQEALKKEGISFSTTKTKESSALLRYQITVNIESGKDSSTGSEEGNLKVDGKE